MSVFHIGKGQNDLQDCPYISTSNRLTSFGDYCMQFIHSERSWGDARSDCQRHGGDLLQIIDPEVQVRYRYLVSFSS